ncbi:MAG: hypothetical protein ACRDYX_04500 [Egibacteraceae bacterium]
MAVDERSRHDLYTRLQDVLGSEQATTLMEHLPPVGWADVATKQDLGALEQRFDLKLEALEHRMLGALHQEIGGLRQEISGVRQEIGQEFGQEISGVHQKINGVQQEIAGLRQEIGQEIASLRQEIGAVRQELGAQTRLYVFSMVGSLATIASLAFAAARIA